MSEDPRQAGNNPAKTLEASDPGPFIGKIKKLESDARKQSDLLAEERQKRQEAEEKSKWAETLSGDVPEDIRDQIYKENLAITQKSADLEQREREIMEAKRALEISKLVSEFGIDAADLEDCETTDAMRVKALEAKVASQTGDLDAAKKGGYEFGTQVSSGVAPKDMTDEQFQAHLQKLKDDVYNRQLR